MQGNNTIHFCTKQMMDLIEHYLNNNLFREDQRVKVTDVKSIHNGFEVKMLAEEKDTEA